MKKQNTQKLGRIRQLGLVALLTTGLASQAQTPLYTGHTDIGIAYEGGWDLHIHDEVNDVEYSPPTDALLVVKYDAHGFVPVGSLWSFLGMAGSETWILPKAENPNLLFLGFGAEEIETGAFVGDQFTLSLKGVSGPGSFAVFDTDLFDDPVLWMNSADGISGLDSVLLPTGSHTHVSWAFSAPGDYTVLFEATGNHSVDGPVSSGDVAYNFRVEAVPEPATGALAGVGALALLLVRKKQRN